MMSVRVCWLLLVVISLSSLADRPVMAAAQAATPQAARPAGASGAIARGEYLTTRVAMCVQCHSGRDRHGDLIDSEKFHGGPIPVQSPWPAKKFAAQAPSLAGLPGFTDEQVVTLLMTGKATGRRPPSPPMPPFRMERADAEAVVAYLRSLR
ncbi:MAG: hypothetical protein IT184_06790 [Acidobacteria bacterium]|nr:hypothetical protein [Acidobacteriota bacterium]